MDDDYDISEDCFDLRERDADRAEEEDWRERVRRERWERVRDE
jgi:hypothetical protein